MSIDLKEVRDDVIGHLAEGANYMRDLPPHDYLLVVAGGALAVASILGANEAWKWWKHRDARAIAALEHRLAQLKVQRKGEAVKMILQERRDKIDRELADGITDLLLTLEIKGKMSRKETDEEFERISKALALYDLIPRQRRFKMLKDEIKSRFNRGVYGKKPHIITGKKPAFRERIGTFANQFWRSKGA
jgi:hypothetical protein